MAGFMHDHGMFGIYFILSFWSSYERIATPLLDPSYRAPHQSTTINQHWPGVTNIASSLYEGLKLSHDFTLWLKQLPSQFVDCFLTGHPQASLGVHSGYARGARRFSAPHVELFGFDPPDRGRGGYMTPAPAPNAILTLI